jgi:hypothetical protein
MQRIQVLSPRLASGPVALLAAIVGCSALAWSWVSCTSPAGAGMAPSLVWDGASFTGAWAAGDRSGVGVWSFRWTPGEPGQDARNIAFVDDLHGPPELTRGDGSYLLSLDLGDDGLRIVPLEHSDIEAASRSVDEPVRVLCRAPIAMGHQFAIAFGVGTGDRIDYHFVILDQRGVVVDRGRLGGGTALHPSCTIGHYKGAIGVAYTLDARDGRQHLALAMPGQTFDVGTGEQFSPLRLTGGADGWRLLYGQNDRAGLVHIGRDGRIVSDRMLSDDIPAHTADFAIGAGGRAVAWSAGRKVSMALLDDDGAELSRCGYSRPPMLSPVRLIAAGAGWGVAWTEMEGRTMMIGRILRCSGDAMIADELVRSDR